MANWIGTVTNAGCALLNRWPEGKISLLAAAGGTGVVPEMALLAQTRLADRRQDASLTGSAREDGYLKLRIRIEAAQNHYLLNQIGVWAAMEGESPVLLALFQSENGVSIPSVEETPDFHYTFYGAVGCANEARIELHTDLSAGAVIGDIEDAVAKHDADPDAHGGLGRKVLFARIRDTGKPDYGLDEQDGGEEQIQGVVLETGTYSGTARVAVVFGEDVYDAENMDDRGDFAQNGALIINQMTEE